MLVGVQHAMLDHQFGVVRRLPGLLAALAESHTRLQLVVVDAVGPHDQVVVLLVALRGLALDRPVVLAEHLVFVLLLVLVQHLVRVVATALLQRRLGGQEVGDELLATLVHHTADHGLRHLLQLGGHLLAHRGRVRVEDDLGARVLPVLEVRIEGQHLLGHHVRLAEVPRDGRLRVVERLLDVLDLRLAVHVERLLAQTLLHVVADLRLDRLQVLRLEARLLRRNVLALAQPGHALGVLPGPDRVLVRRVDVLLEQALIGRVQLGIGVGLVELPVDEVDVYAQVVFGQDVILVVALQRGGIVLYEAVALEGVRDELQVERDVWQGVGVLDAGDQLGPAI